MPFRRYCAYGLAALMLASLGCAKSNPLQPSVSTPLPSIPTTGTLIPNSSQPVTLVVQNAVASASGTTYTFEVATDSAFANKVQTKPGVTEGAGGQTSATLSALPANADYYWHAQATAGGTAGLFSGASKFTIGPLVSIGAPGLVSPANGANAPIQPTLIVTNVTQSGPVGVLAYRFDISTSSSFATIAVSGSSPEGSGQTSFTVGTALAVSTTFYWRATAIDQTNITTGPASATGSFRTVAFGGVAAGIANQRGLGLLWPGAVPDGVNGHAVLGTNCNGEANWGGDTCSSDHAGVVFPSPTLEMLQFFDLFDRGYDPETPSVGCSLTGIRRMPSGIHYPRRGSWVFSMCTSPPAICTLAPGRFGTS